MSKPKVSVIIPVYNAEKYLQQCLDSIINQSLHDIEIICVDDGSTDRSLSIIQAYQQVDSRVIILQQQNKYAGIARNNGMAQAKGEYLAFLDADDFFELDMLRKAYFRCEQDHADLCLWSADYYDTQTHCTTPFEYCLDRNFFPSTIPFSVSDIPNTIFQISAAAPWNKLYKKSMVQANHLFYSETKRSNDTYFACMAMCCAKKITVLDETLVHYRKAHGNTLQATVDDTPLDWYQSHLQLKRELMNRRMLHTVRISFIHFILCSGYHYLLQMRSFDGMQLTYNTLRNELTKEVQELHISPTQLPPWFASLCQRILDHNLAQYLFLDRQEVKEQCARIEQDLHAQDLQIQQLTATKTLQLEQLRSEKEQQIDQLVKLAHDKETQIMENRRLINTLQQEKANLQFTIEKPKLLRRYIKYYIYSLVTWGNKRRRYKIKKSDLYHQLQFPYGPIY